MFSNIFNKISPFIFQIITIIYISYIIVFLGIATINPKYIEVLNIITQTFITLFLLFKFHIFSKKEKTIITKIDRRLIFGSGIILATNLILSKLYSFIIGRNLDNDISIIKTDINRSITHK
jgi:hypothetical protein